MKTINIDTFKNGLRAAARQHGEQGVIHAKALMLEGAMLVDEAGTPIDPASVDIVIRPASSETTEDMAGPKDEEAKSADPSAESVAKSVRSAIKVELDSVPVRKTISVTQPSIIRQYKGVRYLKSAEEAYRFGRFLMAAKGHRKSAEWCSSNGIVMKAHREGVNAEGGFLVPDEFEASLITLREQFGVFRQNAKIYPMSRDTLMVPRRVSGLTAYWVGETRAGTESTNTFDQIQLVAKKMMILTTISNELNEDAIVNLADDTAREIAYQFSLKEDDAGFNGDGTSGFGGVIGLKNAIGSAGVVDSALGTGDLGAMTLGTLSNLFAKLPAYAMTSNCKLYCHKSVYNQLFERLAFGSGGVTAGEISRGMATPTFYGYPVVFSQILPASSVTTDGTVLAYFGDLSLACYLGDRRDTAVALSDSALNAFEQDEIAVRGTQRVEIVCANVGDATNAGPIVQFTR